MAELVQLVNERNEETGTMEKMEAHRRGLLHRAVSVFIYNGSGQLLLQQRAMSKYHSAGLWSNTCCTHPRPGEDVLQAAERRLREEMGIQCTLAHKFNITYRAEVDNGLTEHEYDHVFVGYSNDTPTINKNEVHDWAYVTLPETARMLRESPQKFTPWFPLLFQQLQP